MAVATIDFFHRLGFRRLSPLDCTVFAINTDGFEFVAGASRNENAIRPYAGRRVSFGHLRLPEKVFRCIQLSGIGLIIGCDSKSAGTAKVRPVRLVCSRRVRRMHKQKCNNQSRPNSISVLFHIQPLQNQREFNACNLSTPSETKCTEKTVPVNCGNYVFSLLWPFLRQERRYSSQKNTKIGTLLARTVNWACKLGLVTVVNSLGHAFAGCLVSPFKPSQNSTDVGAAPLLGVTAGPFLIVNLNLFAAERNLHSVGGFRCTCLTKRAAVTFLDSQKVPKSSKCYNFFNF